MAWVYSIIFRYDNNKTNNSIEGASICILSFFKCCKGFVVFFLRGYMYDTANPILITVYFIGI